MLIAVHLCSKIFSHFVKYSEKADSVSKTYLRKIVHEPSFTWIIENEKEGVKLDSYTQKIIEDAYRSAWYVMNESIHAKKDMGLKDHISDKMIEKIMAVIDSESSSVEERVELNHNIDLHLFSFDRQLVSFSDNHVRIFRTIRDPKNNKAILQVDTSHFDVVMGLEDGYWKVLEMKQTESPTLDQEQNIVQVNERFNSKFKAKAINYYPARTPWFDFWKLYHQDSVELDLQKVSELGFNSVRFFIPYSVFGKAYPEEEMLLKLDSFLIGLENNELKGIITLFDFPESFHMDHYPATGQHIRKIMQRYRDNKTIWAWDLKNEADLDFTSYSQEVVISWLQYILEIAKEEAPNHLLTIGWSNSEVAHLFSEELDIISFHSYKKITEEAKGIQELKLKIGSKPMCISEFGKTSYRSMVLPFGSTENEQAIYTQDMLTLMKKEEIDHYAFWTLYDFEKTPSEVFGWKPWIKKSQANMGILQTNGAPKPVLKSFQIGERVHFKMTLQDYFRPFYLLVGLLIFLTWIAARKLFK